MVFDALLFRFRGFLRMESMKITRNPIHSYERARVNAGPNTKNATSLVALSNRQFDSSPVRPVKHSRRIPIRFRDIRRDGAFFRAPLKASRTFGLKVGRENRFFQLRKENNEARQLNNGRAPGHPP